MRFYLSRLLSKPGKVNYRFFENEDIKSVFYYDNILTVVCEYNIYTTSDLINWTQTDIFDITSNSFSGITHVVPCQDGRFFAIANVYDGGSNISFFVFKHRIDNGKIITEVENSVQFTQYDVTHSIPNGNNKSPIACCYQNSDKIGIALIVTKLTNSVQAPFIVNFSDIDNFTYTYKQLKSGSGSSQVTISGVCKGIACSDSHIVTAFNNNIYYAPISNSLIWTKKAFVDSEYSSTSSDFTINQLWNNFGSTFYLSVQYNIHSYLYEYTPGENVEHSTILAPDVYKGEIFKRTNDDSIYFYDNDKILLYDYLIDYSYTYYKTPSMRLYFMINFGNNICFAGDHYSDGACIAIGNTMQRF